MTSDLGPRLGPVLAAYRLRCGLGPEGLALQLGLTPRQVVRLGRCVVPTTPEQVALVAEVFGMDAKAWFKHT